MLTIKDDPRWRDLRAMDPDLAFETDARGRIVFMTPEHILGWRTGTLVGQAADRLLAEPDAVAGFNPFRASMRVRGRRAWLNLASGGHVCMRFTCMPLLDAAGLRLGTLGVGTLETRATAWLPVRDDAARSDPRPDPRLDPRGFPGAAPRRAERELAMASLDS